MRRPDQSCFLFGSDERVPLSLSLLISDKFDRRWLCNVVVDFVFFLDSFPAPFRMTWKTLTFPSFIILKTPAFIWFFEKTRLVYRLKCFSTLVPQLLFFSKLWLPASLIVFWNSFAFIVPVPAGSNGYGPMRAESFFFPISVFFFCCYITSSGQP